MSDAEQVQAIHLEFSDDWSVLRTAVDPARHCLSNGEYGRTKRDLTQ